MKKSSFVFLVVLVLILVVVGFFAWKTITKPKNEADISAAAQVFTSTSTTSFTDFLGNPANLEQHLDSVIVAHTWASWVPTSPEALQNLAAAQAEYRDQDVIVLAINRGEPSRTARQFLEQIQVTNLRLISDKEDQYFSSIGGNTMPETIFYDRHGNVVYHKRGHLTQDELKLRINQALQASKGL